MSEISSRDQEAPSDIRIMMMAYSAFHQGVRWNNTAHGSLAREGDLGLRLRLGRDSGGPSEAQEEECFIFTTAFPSAGSLIPPLHVFGNPAVG